jgi:hypothetical protein
MLHPLDNNATIYIYDKYLKDYIILYLLDKIIIISEENLRLYINKEITL